MPSQVRILPRPNQVFPPKTRVYRGFFAFLAMLIQSRGVTRIALDVVHLVRK